VEVNAEDLLVGPGGGLGLARTADEAEQLPPFEEANYTTPPLDYETPAGWPSSAIAWPIGFGGTAGPMVDPAVGGAAVDPHVQREVASALRAADLENAVVGEGSAVRDRDGEKVGEVARLGFDAASGCLDRLVVRRGFPFTEEFEVPATLVDSVGDGVVYLRAPADQVGPPR
jgi:sporulation protein YlmC with PRC-barrel domain